jgi:hypothetical protein
VSLSRLPLAANDTVVANKGDDSLSEKLYASGHNPALIKVTGLDYECFGELLQLFQPYFHDFTPWTINGYIKPRLPKTRGCKQMVDAATCMSLALTYT